MELVDIEEYKNYKFDKKNNQVYNTNTGKYIKNRFTCGYYYNSLCKNGKTKNFKLHRLIFKSHFPLIDIEGSDIDHINQDKLDNNINNLRIATRSENQCNRHCQKNNKSTGIKNIYKIKYDIFRVIITKDGKKYTKTFKLLDEAIKWRNIKLTELHGEFASF